MSSIFSPCSYLPLTPPFHNSRPYLHLQLHYGCFYQRYIYASHKLPHISFNPLRKIPSTIFATSPANEGTVSVINFEDLMEKDWSFLEVDEINSDEQYNQNVDLIISAGEIEESSKVLISIGSEGFVNRVIDTSVCEKLLVVHDSLFTLACIKEKYDKVKCWQGELIYLPEKWSPFDVLFLYFLPALPFQLGQVLESLAKHCLPDARLVISHPEGRLVAEEQRKQHPDTVVTELPDEMTLQSAAADYSFRLVKFVDEPKLYLAVLKFKANSTV